MLISGGVRPKSGGLAVGALPMLSEYEISEFSRGVVSGTAPKAAITPPSRGKSAAATVSHISPRAGITPSRGNSAAATLSRAGTLPVTAALSGLVKVESERKFKAKE
jgi:hypothetical protein